MKNPSYLILILNAMKSGQLFVKLVSHLHVFIPFIA